MSRTVPIEFLGGIFCFIAFAAIITFLIYQSLNRKAAPGAVPPVRNPQVNPHRGVETRIGKDGFWLRGNRLRRGAKVRYRYYVDEEPMDGTITYNPGSDGHYVYTGHIPAAIEVLHILESGAQQDYDESFTAPPVIASEPPQDNQQGTHSSTIGSMFSGPPAY